MPVDSETTSAEAHDSDDVSDDQHSQATEAPVSSLSPAARPQTPQHQQTRPQHVRSPMSPPSLPSPMSLYQLGISPLSPLHRQLSSPLSSRSFSPRDSDPRDDDAAGEHGRTDEDAVPEDFGGSGDEDEDGLTQDSRDVLVDRLNDLVQRLTGGALQDESISALHAKVDEMEKVLAGRKGAGRPPQESRRPRRLTRPRSLHFGGPPELTDELDPFGIVSPSWFVPQLYSQDSTLSSVMAEQQQQQQKDSSPPHDVGGVAKELSAPAQVSSLPSQEKPPAEAGAQPKISSEVAERIVEEAERLYAEMAEVVKSLQDRREDIYTAYLSREKNVRLSGSSSWKDESRNSRKKFKRASPSSGSFVSSSRP